eukprot:scaffold412_cov311-Pavlova_lutheri.AAC.9
MLQDLSAPVMSNTVAQGMNVRQNAVNMPHSQAPPQQASARGQDPPTTGRPGGSSITLHELCQRLRPLLTSQEATALDNLQEQFRLYPKTEIGLAVRQIVPKEKLQRVLQGVQAIRQSSMPQQSMGTAPPMQARKGITTASTFAELERRRQMASAGASATNAGLGPPSSVSGMTQHMNVGAGGRHVESPGLAMRDRTEQYPTKKASEMLKHLNESMNLDPERQRKLEEDRKKREAEKKKREDEKKKKMDEERKKKEEADRKKKEEQLRKRRENAERKRKEAAEKKKEELAKTGLTAKPATASLQPSTVKPPVHGSLMATSVGASKAPPPAPSMAPPVAPPAAAPVVGTKRPDPPVSHPGPPAKKATEAKKSTGEEELDILKGAGVNLEEETQALVAGLHAGGARTGTESYEKISEESWVRIKPLKMMLGKVMEKFDIKSVDDDVLRLVSLATKARFSHFLERLVILARQRSNAETDGIPHAPTWDPRREVLRIERREREKVRKRQEAEREALLRAAEAKKLKEDDQEKLQKALQEREDRTRTAAANKAAMSAFGKDAKWAKWGKVAGSKTKKEDKAAAEEELALKGRPRKSPMKHAEDQTPTLAPRVLPASFKSRSVNVSLKDCIALMEREPCYAKSTTLFKLYELKTSQHPFSAVCKE